MGKRFLAQGSRNRLRLPAAVALPPANPYPPTSPRESSSNPNPIGIQNYLDSILRSLNDGEPMIGIWGPGGIGKTTLLQSIHNQLHAEARSNHASYRYDFVIWAVASMSFKPESLQREIASRLGLKLAGDATSKSFAQAIYDCLKRRSFLLLLDDLWYAVDLSIIGIPDARSAAGPRRAVVFTTRYKEICAGMDRACRIIKLECLTEDDAFALFDEKVGQKTLTSDPRIRKIAVEIINDHCQRLPLALNATATALASSKTYDDWVFAYKNLKKSSENFPGMAKSFFTPLKLSYDNLDDETKKCFLSCALWPENYSICKDDLIECWLGLGFIEEQDISSSYSKGNHVIGLLSSASLLQPGDVEQREVRMHQTIRGLALWIASSYGEKKEKWMVTMDSSFKEWARNNFNWSKAECISFMFNDIESLPLQSCKCDGLTTLILRGNTSLIRIPPGFFSRLPALSYIDLSHTGIEEIPTDVRRLSKLKFLNLSHTKLHCLPMEVEHLKELEYLLLYRTLNLKPIPRKVLSGLSKLRVLDITASGSGYDLDIRDGRNGGRGGGGDIQDFESFGRDQSRKSLLALGIMVVSVKALCRLSKLSGVSTRRLWMNNLAGFEGTLDLLSPNLLGSSNSRIGKSLRELTIMNCDRLEKLIMVGGAREALGKKTSCSHGPRLHGLEILQLLELRRLTEISWKGVMAEELLPNLRELTIYKCEMLKNVTWVLKLPSLEYFQLQECEEIESVIAEEEDDEAFPKLREMILDELPSLTKIASHPLSFPALESLQVSGCPKLKKLPFGPEIKGGKLKKIQGEKMWWECLQWDDKSIKRELLDWFFFISPRAPLTALPSRRATPAQEKGSSTSSGSFYRAVLLPISVPLMVLSLSTVLSPSILFLCVFLLLVGRWGLLQR
ncbi:Disease resistance protein RPS2 [Apostasia shenzhenica]|uniref:Disease resistance protein RPS2 n=1 Tax=Apostasia shenzhenica TaxID=1088818 RepID=A0A2I0B9T6_9ASPA|nr:Disease resistance protein RPS2 [Apostasia shenzhenica]